MFVIQPYTQRAMVFGGRAHILFVGGGRAFDDRFYCPITLQLLVEPVLTEDGHHYEKHAIQKHFRTLGNFSPLTKQNLDPNIVILDLDLQSIIEDEVSKGHTSSEALADVEAYFENKRDIQKSKKPKQVKQEKKTLVDHLLALPITPQNQTQPIGTMTYPTTHNSEFGTNAQLPLRFGTNAQRMEPHVVQGDTSDYSGSSDTGSQNTMSDEDQETWNAPPGTP